MDIPEPLDLDRLVAEGSIEKHGESYYTRDFKSLPRDVSFYVKKASSNRRYGTKLDFDTPPKSFTQRW
ncbi:hypothetical protein K6675_003171 [Vibrio parahaemolyticus]|uniref:hypothetical protein n=1 Tax=Vibrio parahaemolyticus TaxID=670 RepID=UPI000AE8CA58|nr:hypothetical protein [Vibrio parahaemolyticus]EHK2864379.1 hypothetical protein [Vibrio parahaemolyticus]EHK9100265.1 hypothetical protein [Vibrio parahaemolyticus]EIA1332549.1 hypothetical protein [Vibrio parahaemolyticus]EIT7135471.1 hypothetical protein [Vibrio parahaemolyticus]EIV8630863.1 hypothetical protein [Vibrio parahaemolyticus]